MWSLALTLSNRCTKLCEMLTDFAFVTAIYLYFKYSLTKIILELWESKFCFQNLMLIFLSIISTLLNPSFSFIFGSILECRRYRSISLAKKSLSKNFSQSLLDCISENLIKFRFYTIWFDWIIILLFWIFINDALSFRSISRWSHSHNNQNYCK